MNEINVKLISNQDYESPKIKFDGVVGQDSVINKLKFYLSSHDNKTPFPTMLFTGSHGLGKTFVAKKLAENLHRRFIEVNCGTLSTADDFIQELIIGKIAGDTPVTLLLDEAHTLTGAVTTILLTLLAPSSNNIRTLAYKNMLLEYDLSKINVVLATTDAFRIFPPLLNRCERIYFESYGFADLLDMLQLYLPGIRIEEKNKDLAFACRGRGRDTLKLAQNILRYCHMNKTTNFDKNGWDYIKSIFEIYPCGLNRQEVELLKMINEFQPISSANLAMQMMLSEENIENELEVRCRELAMIKNTSKGRILTEEGIVYLQNVKI